MTETVKQCPPETPVPSGDLVRLQFAPKNPYTKSALKFTGKIPVCHHLMLINYVNTYILYIQMLTTV